MKRVIAAGVALGVGLRFMDAAVDAQEMERGRQQFLAACAACHVAEQGGKLGPDLRGVAGRTAGSLSGFPYSRAMKTSRIVWTEPTLNAFIENPLAVVPRNVMPYPGMEDAGARRDLVTYLLRYR